MGPEAKLIRGLSNRRQIVSEINETRMRRSAHRAAAGRVTEQRSRHTKALVLRICVAVVWALLVGLLMAVGANLLDMQEWLIPAVAVLGGAGAAIYVLFFV